MGVLNSFFARGWGIRPSKKVARGAGGMVRLGIDSYVKDKTSFIVVRAGNQMWPIVVFEVATECTEVKFACTTCDTCEMEKITKSMVNVTSAYAGVITRREHLP